MVTNFTKLQFLCRPSQRRPILLLSLTAVILTLCSLPCQPATITSVSEISTQEQQTIVIRGSGFGTLNPYTGDSSDSLLLDLSEHNWTAGYAGPCYDGACGDIVTLVVDSWTDSEITLGGFSGAYGVAGWDLMLGDQEEILVWNPQTGIGPASITAIVGVPEPGNFALLAVGVAVFSLLCFRKHQRLFIAALLFFLSTSTLALASTTVVGTPAVSGLGYCGPFGCPADPHVQQVYTSSLFSGPVTITGLEFFNTQYNSGASQLGVDLSGTPNIFTISMSTTSANWNTLSATFANNVGADNTQVFSGSLAQSWMFDDTLSITFSTPFTYTPGPDANLLLDCVVTGGFLGTPVFFDMSQNNTIFGSNAGNGVVVSGFGLVTGFVTTSTTPIPEPATFAPLGVGLAALYFMKMLAARRYRDGHP